MLVYGAPSQRLSQHERGYARCKFIKNYAKGSTNSHFFNLYLAKISTNGEFFSELGAWKSQGQTLLWRIRRFVVPSPADITRARIYSYILYGRASSLKGNVPHVACNVWPNGSEHTLGRISNEFTALFTKGRFYKLVLMEDSVFILLGCLSDSRTVSYCFSFGHVARYAPSQKNLRHDSRKLITS